MAARREAAAFLDELFGSALPTDGADLRVALWDKPTKRSAYYRATAPAAEAAHRARDLYVCVSLANGDLGARSRVTNQTAAGIAGVTADLDVVGGPEDKKPGKAAPTIEAALDLARSIAPPTLTVHSGYGLQAWWLLDDGAWVFRTVDDRQAGARLAAQWIALVDQQARQAGWRIDHTQDLARLMRLPDTINAKGGLEAPCRGWPEPIADQDGPRYSVEDLGRLVHGVQPAGQPAQLALAADLDFDPEASPPADKLLALMDNSEQFRRTWRHTRRDGAAWTTSEWDLSLASQAAQAEWTTDEIAALLAYHRREHGGEKLDRPDYFERTIARARTQGRKVDAERERDDALDDLEDLADQARPDPDQTISAFNRVMGGPAVKEFVQDGRDPGTARFSLVLGNGDQVRLGRIRDVTDPARFRDALAVVTGHLLPDVKRAKWHGAVQALLKVRVVRESEDDTPDGVVADWLSRYLYERLPPEPGVEARDQACRRKEPFEDDDRMVHVYASSFAGFVRQALRVSLPDHEVKDLLRAAGFERVTVHYVKADDQPSTRSYYARARNGID